MGRATNRFAYLTTVLAAFLWAGEVYAQHANFVLFGNPNPAAEVPAEQRFVHPVTDPYYHEDSFVTSDVRAWFVYHDFPQGGVIKGGTAKDYAVQVRLALTEQLQIVAYKDGYLDFDSGLTNDSGWNDVAAGLKWNFLQDWEDQLHAAVGVGYELPVGDPSVLQNDDELRLWASVNKGFGPLHLGATVNGIWHLGSQDALGDSDRLIWDLHADYFVNRWFSPVVEVNGFHTFNKGNEVVGFSGLDVGNLGGGDDVVTLGLGSEFRPIDDLAFRVAYELPLTNGDQLYGYRVTASLVFSF
jgi:hypothetical protein